MVDKAQKVYRKNATYNYKDIHLGNEDTHRITA